MKTERRSSHDKAPAIRVCVLLAASSLPVAAEGADPPKAPVPPSPFLPVVYRYADAMLEKGRDVHGPVKTGLFLSALDRTSLAPLGSRPPAPAGIREGDRAGHPARALVGSNLQHDENLLRLLYMLSDLSTKAAYREAADSALRWFLENAPSTATGLLPWGEHLSWDVIEDAPAPADGGDGGTHELFRPWLLWDRCFDVAREASGRFALALWEHQIADRKTGAFDRHAGFSRHSPGEGMDFPRHAGFYIRTWAVAYDRTRNERFLEAIETLVGHFEGRRHAATGLIPARAGGAEAWPVSTLSLAIDCDGAAHRVPEPLASRLRAFAAREDEVFSKLPHEVERTGGFLTVLDAATGSPAEGPTPLWEGRYGGNTTAQVAMMCVSRYENTGSPRYRELLRAAARAYLGSAPEAGTDAWPGTFGQAISLELAAWRATSEARYLDRARELGNRAVEAFFGASPLPRASLKSDHYESITGADTLALALVELHLHILYITAVRYPPNTADR
jgi:pectate lyase-like protein